MPPSLWISQRVNLAATLKGNGKYYFPFESDIALAPEEEVLIFKSVEDGLQPLLDAMSSQQNNALISGTAQFSQGETQQQDEVKSSTSAGSSNDTTSTSEKSAAGSTDSASSDSGDATLKLNLNSSALTVKSLMSYQALVRFIAKKYLRGRLTKTLKIF